MLVGRTVTQLGRAISSRCLKVAQSRLFVASHRVVGALEHVDRSPLARGMTLCRTAGAIRLRGRIRLVVGGV